MKRYVVKQRSGDWIAIDAASLGEAAKRAARCWELPGNAWLFVAEGKMDFLTGNSIFTPFPGKRLILL